MRKKLNVKLVVGAFIGGLAAALLLAGLHEVQIRRNAYALLSRAESLIGDQRYSEALVLYQTYLSYWPSDIDAMEAYARAWDKRCASVGERTQLVLLMHKVLQQKPHLQDLRFRLAINLIALGPDRIHDAILHLDQLSNTWENKAEIKHMLGWCHDAVNQSEVAVKDLHEAIKLDPKSFDSYALLAEILQSRMNQVDEARRLMDKLVKSNPDRWESYVERARFRLKHNDLDAAESDLQAARALAPDETGVTYHSARLSQTKGHFVEATALAERGLKADPANLDMLKLLAELWIQQGKGAEAATLLEKGVEDFPEATELLVVLVDLNIDQERLSDARQRLKLLKRSDSMPGLFNYLQARLSIHDRDYEAAIPLLEKARMEQNPNSDWLGRTHALLGFCFSKVGDNSRELIAYRRAVQQEPNWDLARLGLASALLTSGRSEEASAELERVLSGKTPPAGSWLLQARARLHRNLLRPAPTRDWASVDAALEKAARTDPKNVNLKLVKAEALAAQQKFEESQTLLDDALADYPPQAPESLMLHASRAELLLRQGKFDAALAILDVAGKKIGGDPVELRLARCRIHAARGLQEDFKSLDWIGQENVANYNVETRTKLRRALADVWQNLGEWYRAEQQLLLLATDQPEDLNSRLKLLETYVRTGRIPSAQRLVAEIQKIEGPQGSLWRYGEALIRLSNAGNNRRKLDEARAFVQDLERRNPDWSKAALLHARIDEMLGQYNDAIRRYEQAFASGEIDAQATIRLVQLLVERQRYTRAGQIVRIYQDKLPLTSELARLGAEAAAATGSKEIAVLLAAKAVPTPARDYRDALWLAKIYRQTKRPAEAEKTLLEALNRFKAIPDVWVAMLEFLREQKRQEAADGVLAQAKDQVEGERLDLVLARGQQALHRFADAEAAYAKALAARPIDLAFLLGAIELYSLKDEPAKAAPLLERLLDPQTHAPVDVIVKARRALAVILAERNQADDRVRARELINLNRLWRGELMSDNRVAWLLDGFSPDSRDSALTKFQQSLELQPATAEETAYLALMFEQGQNYEQAAKTLQPLLVMAPDRSRYLALFIRIVTAGEDRLEEARKALAQLEQLEPNRPRTGELRKTLQAAERRIAERQAEEKKKKSKS